mmetsp:Transcript_29434/g.42722  ORF Transcript_29434/g.42722 Transcript_29434/m.42722 type:complete len:95 (-) Transcript_29434:8-292(-)
MNPCRLALAELQALVLVSSRPVSLLFRSDRQTVAQPLCSCSYPCDARPACARGRLIQTFCCERVCGDVKAPSRWCPLTEKFEWQKEGGVGFLLL